jgi:hypothetical protein
LGLAKAAGPAWRVIVPHRPGYVHIAALQEMVDAVFHGLRQLGQTVELASAGPQVPENAILIGAHLLTGEECRVVPDRAIVYNSEHANSEWMTPHYRSLLGRCIVWDYSQDNARMVQDAVGKPVRHVKLGYVPAFTRIESHAAEDIDVLFYGSASPRRTGLFAALRAAGLKFHPAFGVYGAERDTLIARSKLVLNVHAHIPGAFEIVRVAYLLANRKTVICECNPGEQIDTDLQSGVLAAPYENILAKTIELITDAPRRQAIAARGYQAFTARDQAAILREALGDRITRQQHWPRRAADAQTPATLPAEARTARLAAITMVYNDPVFLPIWRRHYGAAVGEHNLFVLDHGSDDGSTESLGAANRLRIPRGDFDEDQRSSFISRFHASLLCYYDAVIFADADEILVPDPAKFTGLADFIAKRCQSFVTAIGIEIQHLPDIEGDLDPHRPILAQRSHGRFAADYCKPLISRVELHWDPGFHSCEHAPAIDQDLYLFHLKAMDLRLALQQARKRRQIGWTENAIRKMHGVQFRLDDQAFQARFFPVSGATLGQHLAEGFDFTAELRGLVTDRAHIYQNFKGAIRKIPGRFHNAIAAPAA